MIDAERPGVSVLVPVYNMQRYLGQCLDSLEAQTIRDAEFICLNDGSTDASLSILEEYAARDRRFKIVDKPNSGYGATMNEGLRRARGRYVGILESDDWAERDCFERLYDLAQANGMCDIVKANHYQFGEAGERFRENYGGELCGHLIKPVGGDLGALVLSTPAIWAALYRRDFLAENRIGFLETPGAAYQDTGFVMKSWLAAESVAICHDAFIHYRTGHEGSSSASGGKVFRVREEYDSIDEFARSRPDCTDERLRLIAAKRFSAYRWNLGRLGWKDKRAFLRATAPELCVIGEEVGWDKALFKPKEWKALQRWMSDPEAYYLDLRLASARNAGKRLQVGRYRFLRWIKTGGASCR